tara:strand:+ start:84 stop:326 length:243 start_codon:yes stop_codon:yes gene_type:complete
MTALSWIKDRATSITDEPIVADGTTYAVERLHFAGRLPARMIREVCKADMVNTDTQIENINVNTKNNRVEYNLTTYRAGA